jgi:hypothetical protein
LSLRAGQMVCAVVGSHTVKMRPGVLLMTRDERAMVAFCTSSATDHATAQEPLAVVTPPAFPARTLELDRTSHFYARDIEIVALQDLKLWKQGRRCPDFIFNKLYDAACEKWASFMSDP